jgi:spore coat polysaccharide biosynthesis protein SpsF
VNSYFNIRVFVQARMSSSRYPGKMLAPLAGRPVLAHVVENAAEAVGLDRIVVLTSSDLTDDPLAGYAERFLGVDVYRGELANVFSRFQGALSKYPCQWFIRVCGDSPLIDSRLIKKMVQRIRPQDDLVTNVAERTFPPGQSVEILKSSTFASIDSGSLGFAQREHVTSCYYANPDLYIVNPVRSVHPELASQKMVLDSLEDLLSIEKILSMGSDMKQDFSTLMDPA